MADPLVLPIFVTSLSDHNYNPIIPDAFFTTHLKGKDNLTKLKLNSDGSDKTWEVKLDGLRFAGGWEDFSAAHCLRDDDVLIFRHDGDMVFHVRPFGRSFSQIQCISSDSEDDDDSEDDNDSSEDDDDNQDDEDEDDSEDDDETSDEDSDSKNISSKKKKSRLKPESSLFASANSCLIAVTPSNLRLNRVCLTKDFTRTNGLNNRWCEIDLMNQRGKSWVLGLRHNNTTGQDFIGGGWKRFCRGNKLKTGSLYRFKLVWNGTRPLLKLCSNIAQEGNCSKANGKAKVSAKSSSEGKSGSVKQNRFLTGTLKPYMFSSKQLSLPRPFARENGIKEAGDITLVDKNGVKWPSYVASASERDQFYITKGWMSFCASNGLKMGETFTLEFVRGNGKTPMLKFCSKAKAKIALTPFDSPREDTETRYQKRARVSAEEGPSHRTPASNISSADTRILQRKQPLQPCSIPEQMTKVRQSIVDTLTGVRGFQSELKIKEQNLEASLLGIDALGEKVLEINKILNMNKI